MINETCQFVEHDYNSLDEQSRPTYVLASDDSSINTFYDADLNQQETCSNFQNDYSFSQGSEINFYGNETEATETNDANETDFKETCSTFMLKDSNSSPSSFCTLETNECLSGYTDEEKNDRYFEAKIPSQATFELCLDDWEKLRLLQQGHRFKRGEWEDYFVSGMKKSNKYCVFAFKDHYVNHSLIRKSRASMSKGISSFVSANTNEQTKKINGKKNFSANGYCVFADCSVRFLIKMSTERQVHVFYQGQVRHAINELNARYFRGKSRQELKETLKHTTPMKEYLQRIQNSNNIGVFGNVDYVGKSTTVYRRISSEAKDQFQALLQLRIQLIQKTLEKQYTKIPGFIQMIQHVPGGLICFDENQIDLFHNQFIRETPQISCLYINCFKESSYVNTTMNSQKLYFYEMCLLHTNQMSPLHTPNHQSSLIPLTCFFTTNTEAHLSLHQWLSMFFHSEKNKYVHHNHETSTAKTRYLVCENSMPLIESLLSELNHETYSAYSIRLFFSLLSKPQSIDSDFDDVNLQLAKAFRPTKESPLSLRVLVHTCTKKIMNEIKQLCHNCYDSFGNTETKINNLKFAIYVFNLIANSETLVELQQAIYSFMCILYSRTINSLVRKSFDYLKSRLNEINSNSPNRKFCLFDSDQQQSKKETFHSNGLFGKSVGMSAFKQLHVQESIQLDKLNETSVFFKMCEHLFEKSRLDIEKCELEEQVSSFSLADNPKRNHDLIYNFVRQFSASLPLWTKVNVPGVAADEFYFPVTSTAHMDRLGLLLSSQESKKETLDIFINKLYIENEKILKINAEDYSECSILSQMFTKTKQVKSPLDDLMLTNSETTYCSSHDHNEFNQNKKQKTFDLIRIDQKKRSRTSFNEPKQQKRINIPVNNEEPKHACYEIELNVNDVKSLDENFKLNLNIIQFYMRMLQSKTNSNEANVDFKVIVFPIQFYSELKSNYLNKHVKSYVNDESINIFNYSLVLIPIKKNENLGLAVIDFRKRKITYYDPFLLNDFECLKILTDFIENQYYLFKKEKFDFRNWKISNDKSLSKANNNLNDPGMFILFLSRQLVNNQDLSSMPLNEIDLFKSQIKNEILKSLTGT